MNGLMHVSNITLRPIGDQLKFMANSFETITITCIFKEIHVEADALTKEAQ